MILGKTILFNLVFTPAILLARNMLLLFREPKHAQLPPYATYFIHLYSFLADYFPISGALISQRRSLFITNSYLSKS